MRKKPILLTTPTKNFEFLAQYATVYPRNVKELYVIAPIKTKNSMFISAGDWYPWKKDNLYRPSRKALTILTPEFLKILIETLLQLQKFVQPPPALQKYSFPPKPITFDVADDLLCAQVLAEQFGVDGENLSKLRNVVDT